MANNYESWTDEQLEAARVAAVEVADGSADQRFTAMERMYREMADALADEQASRAYRRGETS